MQKSLSAAKKSLSAGESGHDTSGTQNLSEKNGDIVDNLAKELEQKRQIFYDDAKAVVERKLSYSKQIEEYRKVKERFEMWKKEYKNRLRETKAKLANSEGGKQSWWGKLSKRYTPA